MVNSTARLSSGERLVRAADDVASLSVATRLQTNLTSLRQSRVNLAQADSMLQIMDNGLRETDEILQRMNALAVQAGSGALTSSERGFLNQEYQQLAAEIDRISETTNFNGVKVLNAQSNDNLVELDAEAGDSYSATLRFNTNWGGNNRWMRIGSWSVSAGTNGNERFYWRNNTASGDPRFNIQNDPTLEGKIKNLVDFWNDPNSIAMTDERFSQIKMELVAPTEIKITGRSRGDLSGLFSFTDYSSHSNVRNSLEVLGGDVMHRSGATSLGRFNYQLGQKGDGSDTGLTMGSTRVVGTTSDLLDTQQQIRGEIRLDMDEGVNITNNRRIWIDNSFNGANNYSFRTNATNPRVHIQIGATLEETLDNAVAFFNELYKVEEDFGNTGGNFRIMNAFQKLEFSREGSDLVIRSRLNGNQTDLYNNNLNFRENVIGGQLVTNGASGTNINMGNATDTGVNTDGVINKDFVGQVQGFEASYLTDNQVRLSVNVGEATYSTIVQETDIQATDRIRLFSDDHGYFDVDLRGGSGMAVTSQADADLYAKQMDNSFRGLQFYQERVMTNYQASNSTDLTDSQFTVTSNDFSQGFAVESISVTSQAEMGTDSARISMVVNGESYVSRDRIDLGVGRYAKVEMVNVTDENKIITFQNGSVRDFDLRTNADADALETLLQNALPIAETINAEDYSFQVGKSSADSIDLTIVNSSYDNLFEGVSTNILTADSAKAAVGAVQVAIDNVTSLRAEVGATQQRMLYASDNVQNAIINQDAARSRLTDTDIASESTRLAVDTVKMNAGVSLLAQANNLRTNIMQDVFDPLAQLSGA